MAARYAVEYLVNMRGDQWVKEEDVVTPDKPGDKVVVTFTWFSQSHNEHNTKHDICDKIGSHFKKRPNFIMHTVEVLDSLWTKLEYAHHGNCCQTSPHKRTNDTRKTCDCMARFMSVACPNGDCNAQPGQLCVYTKRLSSGKLPFQLHKPRERAYHRDASPVILSHGATSYV